MNLRLALWAVRHPIRFWRWRRTFLRALRSPEVQRALRDVRLAVREHVLRKHGIIRPPPP